MVALAGDGCYLFSVPAWATGWPAATRLPTLTVIYDNRGWRAPKQSTLGVHPAGVAAAADDFAVSLEPEADLPGIAPPRAGLRRHRHRPGRPPAVLKDALAAVHAGRSAVVSVHLPPV